MSFNHPSLSVYLPVCLSIYYCLAHSTTTREEHFHHAHYAYQPTIPYIRPLPLPSAHIKHHLSMHHLTLTPSLTRSFHLLTLYSLVDIQLHHCSRRHHLLGIGYTSKQPLVVLELRNLHAALAHGLGELLHVQVQLH